MKTNKELYRSILIVILLVLGLAVTSYALANETVSIEDHRFNTGVIKINLNDGKVLQFKDINGNDINTFEPGMTVVSDFFVRNEGTGDMYYRIYFTNVEGDLVDVIKITIKDEDRVIYSGNMKDMDRAHTKAVDDLLHINETKTLTIVFEFDSDANNSYKSKSLSFNLTAEGTQVRNNPDKEFNR